MTFYIRPKSDDLMHHGIKGQKWGVRRFQNPDGSLTPAGKNRYKNESYEKALKLYNNKTDYNRLKEIDDQINQLQKDIKSKYAKEEQIDDHKYIKYTPDYKKSKEYKKLQDLSNESFNIITKYLPPSKDIKNMDDSEFDAYDVEISEMLEQINRLRQNDGIKHSINELYHYGIKGQKWGVRRFQNPDGSLTEAGKERYGEDGKINKKEIRKEVRKDNFEAFEAGKDATILRAAYEKERNRAQKATERLNKKPDSERRQKDAIVRNSVANYLFVASQMSSRAAEAKYYELCQKYGKEAISDIKYDKNGWFNEKTQTFIEKLSGSGFTKGQAASLLTNIYETEARRQLFGGGK